MRRFIIPFVTTLPETDILFTFALTPLWWFLGFSPFIYQFVALWAFIKLLIMFSQNQKPIRIPKVMWPYVLFLVFYMLSVLINVGSRPPQRIAASINNWSMLVMGFLVVMVVYNSSSNEFLSRLLKVCKWLCLVTGLLGLASLLLWMAGYQDLQVESWLGKQVPKLMTYPFFHMMMNLRLTFTDWWGGEVPRLTIYSEAPSTTGGFMLIVLPMFMLYGMLKERKSFFDLVVLVLALNTLLFSMSRTAICAFVGAFIFVHVIQKGKTLLISLVLGLIAPLSLKRHFPMAH